MEQGRGMPTQVSGDRHPHRLQKKLNHRNGGAQDRLKDREKHKK